MLVEFKPVSETGETITRWRAGRYEKVDPNRMAFLCPHCKRLISWIPVPKINRCSSCRHEIEWPEDAQEKFAEYEKNKDKAEKDK